MADIAIIGGTGLGRFANLEVVSRVSVDTPYGTVTAPLTQGRLEGHEVVFLARHGDSHTLPPHRINYRANIWALQATGVKRIMAVNAVGGITAAMSPGVIVLPDQLIDYTTNRAHTFFDGPPHDVEHIDFTWPYDTELRQALISAAQSLNLPIQATATYAAVQGPRLETAAEICRLERDGCDIVGMTGMPEAALARELGIAYASCALVVNWAAGKTQEVITMEHMHQQVDADMAKVRQLLITALGLL